MARPTKIGLDYFPVDVVFDNSTELVIAQYGASALGILIRIFQKIFGDKGYYTNWDDDTIMLFCKHNDIDKEFVSKIVNACIKRKIFDKTLYEKYEILTSIDVQQRYFEAIARRKTINTNPNYLLIEIVNVNNNSVNVDTNATKKSKEKKSKEKKSKVKESKVKSESAHFVKPSLNDVNSFVKSNGYKFNGEDFFNYYESRGWIIGNTPMNDWHSACAMWNKREETFNKQSSPNDVKRIGSAPSFDIDKITEKAMYNDNYDI